MKFNLILISFAIVSNINAISLQQIKQSTLQNNKNLEIYDTKINISKKNENLDLKWNNIVLGFGVNDILINDITSRDKEAMQTQYITASQIIPISQKKENKNKISKIQTSIYALLKKDKNIRLNSKILENLNNYKIIKQKIKILKKLQSNIKEIKTLQNQRYKTTSLAQIDIVTNDSEYLNIRLKIQTLENKLKIIKLNIQNIAYIPINKIQYELSKYKLDKVNITKLLSQNNMYKVLEKKVLKNKQKIELEESKKIADIKLNIGYYQRESFDDYVGFSINYPLSIYGREDIKINQAKQEVLQSQIQIKEFENDFTTNILTILEKQKISYTNYGFIKEQIIPKKEYILKLLISNSRNTSINTLEQLKIKNKILNDNLRANDVLLEFYNTKAKLAYFKGVSL